MCISDILYIYTNTYYSCILKYLYICMCMCLCIKKDAEWAPAIHSGSADTVFCTRLQGSRGNLGKKNKRPLPSSQ